MAGRQVMFPLHCGERRGNIGKSRQRMKRDCQIWRLICPTLVRAPSLSHTSFEQAAE